MKTHTAIINVKSTFVPGYNSVDVYCGGGGESKYSSIFQVTWLKKGMIFIKCTVTLMEGKVCSVLLRQ